MTGTAAFIAIALALTPIHHHNEAQTVRFVANDYARLSGHYQEAADRQGVIHVSGSDRGTLFDLAIRPNGSVEGNVGDYFVTFTAREADGSIVITPATVRDCRSSPQRRIG